MSDSFSDVWDRRTIGGPSVEFKIDGRHKVMKLDEAKRFVAALTTAIEVAEEAVELQAKKGAA